MSNPAFWLSQFNLRWVKLQAAGFHCLAGGEGGEGGADGEIGEAPGTRGALRWKNGLMLGGWDIIPWFHDSYSSYMKNIFLEHGRETLIYGRMTTHEVMLIQWDFTLEKNLDTIWIMRW